MNTTLDVLGMPYPWNTLVKGDDIELKFLFAFTKCMVLIFCSCLCAMGGGPRIFLLDGSKYSFHIQCIPVIASNIVAKFTTLQGCEEQVMMTYYESKCHYIISAKLDFALGGKLILIPRLMFPMSKPYMKPLTLRNVLVSFGYSDDETLVLDKILSNFTVTSQLVAIDSQIIGFKSFPHFIPIPLTNRCW